MLKVYTINSIYLYGGRLKMKIKLRNVEEETISILDMQYWLSNEKLYVEYKNGVAEQCLELDLN